LLDEFTSAATVINAIDLKVDVLDPDGSVFGQVYYYTMYT
jgi:hypothetical protein